ncbi:MAG: hypothetical protein R3F17_07475 [Planctomycetota bacterium]
MSRNLLRRVELCFPISNPAAIRQRVMNEDLLLYWRPGAQGWESIRRDAIASADAGGEPFDCQEYLMARYLEHAQLNVPEA